MCFFVGFVLGFRMDLEIELYVIKKYSPKRLQNEKKLYFGENN